ncbi:hypothetical protein [Bradyrhizobium sp. USDA 4452]
MSIIMKDDAAPDRGRPCVAEMRAAATFITTTDEAIQIPGLSMSMQRGY